MCSGKGGGSYWPSISWPRNNIPCEDTLSQIRERGANCLILDFQQYYFVFYYIKIIIAYIIS